MELAGGRGVRMGRSGDPHVETLKRGGARNRCLSFLVLPIFLNHNDLPLASNNTATLPFLLAARGGGPKKQRETRLDRERQEEVRTLCQTFLVQGSPLPLQRLCC